MGRSAGSGNPAWKAAMVRAQRKPGFANRQQCVAIARHNGQRCGHIALKGVSCCQWHGGRGMQVIVKNRQAKYDLSKRKRRGEGFTADRGA
ncbi:hypothetical protein ABH975_003475 [Bradyrhizobium ottawaense]